MTRDLLLPRRLRGALVIALASVVLAPAHAAAAHHGHGLSLAPAGLVAAIAKTQTKQAAKDPAYRIAKNGCASLKAGPKGRALKGCFAKSGERFASGKDTVGLHLVAWGRTHHLQPVSLKRAVAKANRIEYRGKHISEWWRVLPMGYEQGFTLEQAPKGHGEVVLRLQANRAPKLERGALSWGSLHYGKLRVVDATGKALPSRLSAHGKTITLAFGARHAQFPVRIDPTVWLQPTALTTLNDPGNENSAAFGFSIALDSTDTIALVGADCAPYNPTTNACGPGAAYIYALVSGRWTLAATLNGPAAQSYFGYSVALDSAGDTALVGAYGTNSQAGVAYLYTAGAGWTGTPAPKATLTDPGTGSDYFGQAVALSGTGTIALVGAPNTNSNNGAAYIYTEPASGGWVSTTTPAATLAIPSNPYLGYFGQAVALNDTGTTALVGAPFANSLAGAAYIYDEPTAGGWVSTTTPTATLTASGSNELGCAVALDSAGSTALVGAWDTNLSAGTAYAGAAYIYDEPTSGGWASSSTPTATLTATGSGQLGWSVALNNTGTTALVGAPFANSLAGAAYIYDEPSGGWVTSGTPTATLTATNSFELGSSVALFSTGTTALVGADGTNGGSGAVYEFPPSSLSAALNVPPSVATSAQYGADYIVTNNASAASSDVHVQMPIPSGATDVSVSSTQGSCFYDTYNQLATCDLGAIAGGNSTATAVLTLKSGATSGTITQTASLVNGSPNLAQTASTSVVGSGTSGGGTGTGGLPPGVGGSSGGGGAIGPWALFGLLGLAGGELATRRRSIGRR